MARPAWTNIADADIAQDALGKTGTVYTALRNNARAARVLQFGVDWAVQNTSSSSWQNVTGSDSTVTVDSVVDYTGIARRVLLEVDAWVASGTGEIRLVDVTNAVNGATQNVTATASGTHVSLEVAAVVGTALYRVQFRHPGSVQINAQADDHYTGRVEY